MTKRGIYDRHGELFGFLINGIVYDLEEVQTGYFENGVIYANNGEKQWDVRGDGLYTPRGEAVGYLGENYQETR
ncbi:MAG: hypothetical protein JXN59_07000 [Anaerolineae bacterium]|nr:hypothetical protein [Anaerolineae bacterium]